MATKSVLSLVRATGDMHLGNYLGAARDFVELDRDPEKACYFGVADLHALTSLPDAAELRPKTRGVIRSLLAAGIDPDNSALFMQSAVPETSELFWLLCNVMSAGELQRSKTFKEMSEKQADNVNAGLLAYPVLMAADILGPQADLVPVGDDQMAHLEMTRNIAKRFNHRYGETLRIARAVPQDRDSYPRPRRQGQDEQERRQRLLDHRTVGRCLEGAANRPTRTRHASAARIPATRTSVRSGRSISSFRHLRTSRRSRTAVARRASVVWTARRSCTGTSTRCWIRSANAIAS